MSEAVKGVEVSESILTITWSVTAIKSLNCQILYIYFLIYFFLPFFIVLVISYYIFIEQIGKVSFIINVKTSLKLEPWKECEWRALELLEYLCIAVTLQEKEMTQWNGTELLEAVQKDKLKGAEAQ